MSWNVTVYLEKLNKKTGKWEFVSCVHDNFKYLLHSTCNGGFNEFETISKENVSDELRARYTSDNSYGLDYFDAKVVSMTESKQYAETDIEKARSLKKALYIALGLPEYVDDEYEEWEDPDKYDTHGNIKKNWNPLTFPVNKDLFEKVQLAEFNCIKAYKILGMTEAAEALVNYDDECRFILISG